MVVTFAEDRYIVLSLSSQPTEPRTYGRPLFLRMTCVCLPLCVFVEEFESRKAASFGAFIVLPPVPAGSRRVDSRGEL